MNIYKVYVDNGLDYEDLVENMYIIVEKSEEKAKLVGIELFNTQWFEGYAKNVSCTLITESDNDIPIQIKYHF